MNCILAHRAHSKTLCSFSESEPYYLKLHNSRFYCQMPLRWLKTKFTRIGARGMNYTNRTPLSDQWLMNCILARRACRKTLFSFLKTGLQYLQILNSRLSCKNGSKMVKKPRFRNMCRRYKLTN